MIIEISKPTKYTISTIIFLKKSFSFTKFYYYSREDKISAMRREKIFKKNGNLKHTWIG